jgi:aminoglycoside 2'-N-acetyltransferase I
MVAVTVVHTAQLDRATRGAVRRLLDRAFGNEFGNGFGNGFGDDDWDHALGGLHALAHDGDRLVGHGAVVQRRLVYGERALRAGYVEAVAVEEDARRRGIASAVMAALEDVIGRAYDLGALSATDAGSALYLSRGWQLWRGPTSALTPSGLHRTPDDDGSVHVLPGPFVLDLDEELACDWRDGDLW